MPKELVMLLHHRSDAPNYARARAHVDMKERAKGEKRGNSYRVFREDRVGVVCQESLSG